MKIRTQIIRQAEITKQISDGQIRTAQDIGAYILDQIDPVTFSRVMARYTFEHALDWIVGLRLQQLIRNALDHNKKLRPFRLEFDTSGDPMENIMMLFTTGSERKL